MTRADAIVVGGGVAGAAAAARLAAQGREVVLFDSGDRGGPKVCGEFLGGGAMAELDDLAVPLQALGAVGVRSIRLSLGRRTVEAPLPFRACGLSRRRLDGELLALAGRCGADVRRGTRVRRLTRAGALWEAEGVRAPVLLLATGKHDLPGCGRPAPETPYIGFKAHLRPAAGRAIRSGYRIEIGFYDGGYAGLQPVEGGAVNLCLIVSKDRYRALGRNWEALLAALAREAPAFASLLDGAEPLTDRPATVSRIPYGWVHAPGGIGDGRHLYRLGDQFAVIPSFAGDGIGMALRSARVAADSIVSGGSAADFHAALGREVASRVRRAALIGRVAEAGAGRGLIFAGCRLAPRMLTWIAAGTRAARCPPP